MNGRKKGRRGEHGPGKAKGREVKGRERMKGRKERRGKEGSYEWEFDGKDGRKDRKEGREGERKE